MRSTALGAPDGRAGRPPDTDPAAPSIGYLPGLDGIRAVAVVAVLAYHGGLPGAAGGFFGVDVFFALSGFLITSLLVEEWGRSETIRLGAFWGRRARRLLPALVCMVVVVVVGVAVLLPPDTYPTLRGDALAALFYVANWHFIAAGSNYFSATGTASPLTHTWSLAIEEQFYLVWPLVVLGVLRVTRSLHALLGVAVVGAAASALEMAVRWSPSADLNRLYEGTDTHAQCMLVGAALAVALVLGAERRRESGRVLTGRRAARLARGADAAWTPASAAGRRCAVAAGVAGLATWVVLFTTTTFTDAFVWRGGFLAAALATVGVIVAVACVPGSLLARALSLAPVRFLGRISYGVYLWHYPLFCYLDAARTGLDGLALFALRVTATVCVATLSFVLVERPVRQRAFFGTWQSWLAAPAALGTGALVVLVATAPVGASAGLAARPARPPALTAQRDRVVGRPTVGVLLVGDSMAWTLGNGLTPSVTAPYGVRIWNAGVPNCALVEGTFRVQDFPPQTPAPSCDPTSGAAQWPAIWASAVETYHPEVAVLLDRLDIVDHLVDGQWVHIGEPAYDALLQTQLNEAIAILGSGGAKVVLLTSPYYDTGEQPDGAPWPEDDPVRVDEWNAMLEATAAAHPGRVYVLDLNKIADPDGVYQPVVDGVPIRFTDGIHWTYQGDWWLAPQLLPAFEKLGTGAGGTATDITDLDGPGPGPG